MTPLSQSQRLHDQFVGAFEAFPLIFEFVEAVRLVENASDENRSARFHNFQHAWERLELAPSPYDPIRRLIQARFQPCDSVRVGRSHSMDELHRWTDFNGQPLRDRRRSSLP